MTRPTLTLLLVAMFLAVYLEATVEWPRSILHAQVDLLPAFMVYVALSADVWILMLAAMVGGLWFDSMSANPLGISMLPLFVVGLFVQHKRDLILRDLPYAQMVVGLAASAVVPVLTLLLLVSVGGEPLLGAGSLWQWLVMAVGGAVATPVIFRLFDRLNAAFTYPVMTLASESIGREDREIKRGRN